LVLDDIDEDAMAPDPAVTGSSGGGARGSGGDGESVGLPVAVLGRLDPLMITIFRVVIIGMCVTYSHMTVGPTSQ
jgi:hypothetical protein